MDHLAAALSSCLARHVTALGLSTSFKPSPAQLQQVCSRMPMLRSLIFEPAGVVDDWRDVALTMPAMLRTLRFTSGMFRSAEVSRFLTCLSPLQSLHSLTLCLMWGFGPEGEENQAGVSYAPLSSLPRLTKLHIVSTALTPTQIHDLRALCLLEQFTLSTCGEQQLESLLEPPHNTRMQWTRLPCTHSLNDAVAARLPSLPRLELLSCFRFPPSLSSLALLSHLQSLRELVLYGHEGAENMDAMLLALTEPMPSSLMRFSLSSSSLTADELADLLSLMDHLLSLDLDSMSQLDSFLFVGSVCRTLRSFLICNCAHEELTPQRRIEALQESDMARLQELEICSFLSAQMDEDQLALLKPPSLLIPSLRKFAYRPLEMEDWYV